MNEYLTKIIFYGLVLTALSCSEKPESKEKTPDVSFLLHTYNSQLWGGYLPNRPSNDSLLTERLLDIAFVITDLARTIGANSGGLNDDGTLFKPMIKVSLESNEIDKFYESLLQRIQHVHHLEGRDDLKEELSRVIHFVFFNDEGTLSKEKLASMSTVESVSKLFILENICYYLVVKYS